MNLDLQGILGQKTMVLNHTESVHEFHDSHFSINVSALIETNIYPTALNSLRTTPAMH